MNSISALVHHIVQQGSTAPAKLLEKRFLRQPSMLRMATFIAGQAVAFFVLAAVLLGPALAVLKGVVEAASHLPTPAVLALCLGTKERGLLRTHAHAHAFTQSLIHSLAPSHLLICSRLTPSDDRP